MPKSLTRIGVSSVTILQNPICSMDLINSMPLSMCCLYTGIFVCAYANMKIITVRSKHVASKAVREERIRSLAICCRTPILRCAASMQVLPMRSNQIFLLDAKVLCLNTKYNRNGRQRRMGKGVLLDDELIAQIWGNFDPNFMTPLQTQQSLDLAFEDASPFDVNSEILQFTNLDDSIVIDPQQAYGDFDFR